MSKAFVSYSHRDEKALERLHEYELYLKADDISFHRPRNKGPMSAEQSADALWHEFISHAGVDHE